MEFVTERIEKTFFILLPTFDKMYLTFLRTKSILVLNCRCQPLGVLSRVSGQLSSYNTLRLISGNNKRLMSGEKKKPQSEIKFSPFVPSKTPVPQVPKKVKLWGNRIKKI